MIWLWWKKNHKEFQVKIRIKIELKDEIERNEYKIKDIEKSIVELHLILPNLYEEVSENEEKIRLVDQQLKEDVNHRNNH